MKHHSRFNPALLSPSVHPIAEQIFVAGSRGRAYRSISMNIRIPWRRGSLEERLAGHLKPTDIKIRKRFRRRHKVIDLVVSLILIDCGSSLPCPLIFLFNLFPASSLLSSSHFSSSSTFFLPPFLPSSSPSLGCVSSPGTSSHGTSSLRDIEPGRLESKN